MPNVQYINKAVELYVTCYYILIIGIVRNVLP